MRFSEKFEQLHSNKYFKLSVYFFHIFAVVYFFWQLDKRTQFSVHDVVVTLNILILLLYWKSFARMKKKEFEKN